MKIPIRILMDRYQSHLYRIAFNICQNREDAEDVVQDTFLQYHILKKEFEDELSHIAFDDFDELGNSDISYFNVNELYNSKIN